MNSTEIQTENLRLVLQTPEEILEWVDGTSPSVRAQISPEWLARVRGLSSADPWTCSFSIVHRGNDTVIGQCGYKGPPDANGIVEIAYGVDADYQGRGYATEAAQALVAFAFAFDLVRGVRAHTLIEANASARVLAKCGFTRVGEVIDPEDGPVWRWEIHGPRA